MYVRIKEIIQHLVLRRRTVISGPGSRKADFFTEEKERMTIEKLKKRDGRLVAFDKEKIAAAIAKAFEATYKPGQEDRAAALADAGTGGAGP